MRFLIHRLGSQALNELAVELFRQEHYCLDNGLFHSFYVLGRVTLETEVELFVILGNRADAVVEKEYSEQVQV